MAAKMSSLSLIQIYFDDKQLSELYGFARPFKNETLTHYFENKPIADLVPTLDTDFIGVCSWRLREKRQSGNCPMILGIYGNDDLSEEKILNADADIINLRPFSPGHQMLANSAIWHGGPNHNYAWENAIKELQEIIDIPKEVSNPIYENAFVARKEIYHEYVSNCLHPVLQFMSMRDTFLSDSGYAAKKERQEPGSVKRYREMTGRNDWPIAPFVLERLFSIWIENRNYKIINL
jgi:hypothetical protein